jgi:hypothetical protein
MAQTPIRVALKVAVLGTLLGLLLCCGGVRTGSNVIYSGRVSIQTDDLCGQEVEVRYASSLSNGTIKLKPNTTTEIQPPGGQTYTFWFPTPPTCELVFSANPLYVEEKVAYGVTLHKKGQSNEADVH